MSPDLNAYKEAMADVNEILLEAIPFMDIPTARRVLKEVKITQQVIDRIPLDDRGTGEHPTLSPDTIRELLAPFRRALDLVRSALRRRPPSEQIAALLSRLDTIAEGLAYAAEAMGEE